MTIVNIPDPLHPAVVHFPIVLILIGTAAAIAALVWPRAALALNAAILLSLGAAGAIAATWSGEEDEEIAEQAGPQAERIFEEHEEWGERSRNAAILASLMAVAAAVALKRAPRISRSAAALSAVIALAASWCVMEAGHYGGRLVYEYGVGIRQGTSTTPGDN